MSFFNAMPGATRAVLRFIFLFVIFPSLSWSLDTDGDGIDDLVDNCTLVINPNQRDSNQDGYGNWCDGDLRSDGIIDWEDINRTYWYFGTLGGEGNYNPDADVNGDSVVNSTDAGLIKNIMNTLGVPGPSADYDQPNNEAPVISGTAVGQTVANNLYQFTPGATDNDGDELQFSIVNLPIWALFNAATGRLSGTPTLDDLGVYADIVISVSDGEFSVSLDAFDINVVDSSAGSTQPTIAGCTVFPTDNFWNTPIIDYPLHPKNTDYINQIGLQTELHPDFGDGYRVDGALQSAYGIAYALVSDDPARYENNPEIHKKSDIPLSFMWWDESDCQQSETAAGKICTSDLGSYPSPAESLMQAGDDVQALAHIIESGTDAHLVAIDIDDCVLYEVQHYDYTLDENTITNVSGDSGAIWDLGKNEQRIPNHTSADASGLAIFPGLVRFDEVFKSYDAINGHEYGEINHAIRVTLPNPQNSYMYPATHSDGNQLGGCGFSAESNCLPMGQKLRLTMTLEEINSSGFTESNKVILRAMRQYGMVVADTGGNLFFSGDHDPRWVNDDVNVNQLKQLSASDFEAVIKPQGERVYEYSWSSGNSVLYLPESTEPDYGDDEFEFVVFGDFNQGGCERTERVEELINLMATQKNSTAAFYVSTGDLIDGYIEPNGGNLSFAADIDNSNCGEGASTGNIQSILAPIKERPAFSGLNASFYPAIGNHDGGWGSGWYPDPWQQGICDFLQPNTPMDYINHTVPDLTGAQLEPIPENTEQINNLFCDKESPSTSVHPEAFYYSFSYKNSHFIMLSLYHDYQSISESQIAFLETELSTAKDAGKHIFVFGHAPLYTTNFDRHRPTTNWRTYVDLFDEYNVDMYLNGHNHSYERSFALKGNPADEDALVLDDTGTVYLTVGSAGGGSDGTPDISNELTEVTALAEDWTQVKTWSKSAFAREITVYVTIKVSGDQVTFEAHTIGIDDIARINSGGNLKPLDEIIIGPRKVDDGRLRKYE